MSLFLYWFAIGIHKDTQLNPKDNTCTTNDKLLTTTTTTIDIKPKEKTTDADVVYIERPYWIDKDSNRIDIPVKKTYEETIGSQVVVKHEADMTPIIAHEVNKQFPKWELGIGIGYHEGDVYVPIEIQRNYKKDSAVSYEIHLDSKGSVIGHEVMYKKLIR